VRGPVGRGMASGVVMGNVNLGLEVLEALGGCNRADLGLRACVSVCDHCDIEAFFVKHFKYVSAYMHPRVRVWHSQSRVGGRNSH
jgi:hypothetical protein